MNKKLVAAALGLAFAAPVFADSSNVTLYGRIHQTLDHESTSVNGADRGGNFVVEDASSRLGVRGVEDLGGGLNAIFAYEFGVDTDTVNTGATNMSTRHAYLGLKGSYGLFVVGSQDGGNDSQAPLYNQASLIGSVSNNGGPLTTVGGGTAILSNAVAIQRQQRVGNSFGYATKIGGVAISARHSMQGDNDQPNNTATLEKENGSRATEVAADYKVGALTLGAGFALYEQQGQDPVFQPAAAGNAGGLDPKNTVQGIASYNFGAFTVSGLIAQTKFYGTNPINNEDTNTEYALSASVPLTANSGLFGMYADSERNNIANAAAGVVAAGSAAQGTADVTQAQIAYYYDFSKRTRTYVGFNRVEVEGNSGAVAGTKREQDNFTIGLRHNF